MNILITGSSRGIGLALVTQALAKGNSVLAVARDVSKLEVLQRDYPKTLTLVEANVSEPAGIKTVASAVAKVGSLDTLINNAGVYKKDVKVEDFAESFHVNATTPFLVTEALLPYLAKSKAPKVAQISTLMGSIHDNGSGGSYAYRSSKSALNMITRSLSVDHPNVTFVLLHPGWVKTEMGGSNAPTEIADSAKGIWQVIETAKSSDSGSFKDFQGRNLSW